MSNVEDYIDKATQVAKKLNGMMEKFGKLEIEQLVTNAVRVGGRLFTLYQTFRDIFC